MNLPKSMLLYLWRGYVFGNSSKSKNGQIQLSTVSHQLADDLQELVLKIFGRVVQVRKQTKKYSYKEGTHTLYVINMTPDKGRDDYAAGQVAFPLADIGLTELAMHSAVETTGAKDFEYLVKLAETFFA